MAKIELPGFKEYDAKLKAGKIKKAKEKIQEPELDEKKVMQGKKGFYILKERFKHNPVSAHFLGGLFVTQMVYFMIGSIGWATSFKHYGQDDDVHFSSAANMETADLSWTSPTYGIYGDMEYKQAIKNAYLWDDFRNGKGGLFQGICGLLSILIACGVGAKFAKMAIDKNMKKAREDLKQLDQLKEYGIDAVKLIQEMEPFIVKLVSKMSKIDRGYFDNLLANGLKNADYKTCIDIISGHLKSNPEDYEQLVAIIDEHTLPESIKKKYGKGKTISFGAAQAMMQHTKD